MCFFWVTEPRAPWIDDGYSNSSDHVQILWDMGETNKSLECTVHGEPSPNIVWTRDGHVSKAVGYTLKRRFQNKNDVF